MTKARSPINWRANRQRGRPIPARFSLAIAVSLAFAFGGCSYKLGSLLGKDKDGERPELSHSTTPGATPISAGDPTLLDADMALAKAAATEAVGRDGKDVNVPWENPRTGARGSVTPLTAAYTQDGLLCRDFLASYVRENGESWLQGEACRMPEGDWQVRSLKSLKRP